MALPSDFTYDEESVKGLSAEDAAKLSDVAAKLGLNETLVTRVVFVPMVKAFVHHHILNAQGEVKLTPPVFGEAEVETEVDGEMKMVMTPDQIVGGQEPYVVVEQLEMPQDFEL